MLKKSFPMLFDEDENFDPYDDLETLKSENTVSHKQLDAPHMSDLIIGHNAIEKLLLSAINKNTMPHALIFSGQKGIGKSTMAQRLARALLNYGIDDSNQDSLFGESPKSKLESFDIDKDNPIFSQVASKGNPDLITIERLVDPKTQKPKNELSIEMARKIAPFLRMTSSNGGWRIVIVDDADTMNRNAQNAILKILEEPPKNTLLILVCHRLGAMIPTIRSRCRVIEFDGLSRENFNTLLKIDNNDLSDQEINLLHIFSNQSIGQAKIILENKGLETIQSCLDILQSYPKINDLEVHKLSDSAGRFGQDNSFNMIEMTFLKFLENIIQSKARETELIYPFNMKGFKDFANDFNLEKCLSMHAQLKDLFAQAHYASLDKRVVIINAYNLINT